MSFACGQVVVFHFLLRQEIKTTQAFLSSLEDLLINFDTLCFVITMVSRITCKLCKVIRDQAQIIKSLSNITLNPCKQTI